MIRSRPHRPTGASVPHRDSVGGSLEDTPTVPECPGTSGPNNSPSSLLEDTGGEDRPLPA